MSNRSEASRQTAATEDSLRLLIDTTPAFIHTALPDGALDFLNEGWQEYVGLSLTDLLGWRWTTAIHPDDVEEFVDKWRASVASGEPFVAESRVRRADGEYRWFLHRKVPLRDETGEIVKWYGSSLEIEERKWAEVELRRSEAYLAEAQRLSHTGSFGCRLSTGEMFWSEETFRIYGYDSSTQPALERVLQRVHPEDRALVQERIDRASRDGQGCQVECRLLLPDDLVKHVYIVAHASTNESGIIEFIGAVMDVTERKRAEEELRRSEAYLSEAQRLSHTGSFGWDVLSGEIYWSDETFRVFELEPKTKITTELILQRTHPDDRQAVRQVLERASSERTEFALEHRLLMPDGSIKYLRVVGRPLQDEGRRSEFVGAVTDITDQKRAEESLRESEAYLAEAQRLSQTGSWAWNPNPNSDIRYWSEECYRVLGFDPAGPLPRFEEFFQNIHPDDQAASRERFEKAIRDKADSELDYRIVHPDKGVRDIHVVGHAVLDRSGDLHEFVGTVIDITERKRAEEELRASERKYRDLVDTTPAFIHTALPDGSLDFLSRGWLEYGGLTLTDLKDWRWAEAIHPEDIEGFVDKWRGALASGKSFEAESRVRRADGEYRWFLQRNVPLRNEAGQIVKWYGTGIEIEERKIAEQEIHAKEIELQQIVNLSPQHIGVFGPSGGPLYLNHAGLEYFGAIEWEADADRPEATRPWQGSRLDLVHPEDREHFVSERKKGFLEGRPFEHESRLRRHDGQFRWFLIRFAPLKDERGDITRWIGTGTDIEDRKRAEDEIKKENIILREEIDKTSMFEEIVGVSAPLQSVLTDLSKVAPTDSTVLITGETGTGKELVARAIHKRSLRSARPFVSVNCAAIPTSLIASELFGHEKGAFTGATQRRLGRFELAEGGTIFLDEVGELSAEIQIALLRVLQEREFERVGSAKPIRADVRVIAATNRDLETAIEENTFRSDLYYRLNVFPLEVPPLRERREDIPLLVEYFLHRFAKQAGKRINKISKETLNTVESYDWPGNVRELQNVVERAVIVSESDALDIDERWLLAGRTAAPVAAQPSQQIYRPRTRTTQEKEAIETALMECKGRVSGPFGAASQLGLPSSTLESKIKSLKIDKGRFRQQ